MRVTSSGDLVVAGADPLRCPPGDLRLLLRDEDPQVRGAAIIGLAVRLAEGRAQERGERAGFAAALPGRVDGAPEAALALARVYLELRAEVRPGPWPAWRGADLPVLVRVAWLGAEIADRPRVLRDEPVGEVLYQAVGGIDVADVDDPELLARELVDRADPVLRGQALRVVRGALRAGVLAPSRARALVAELAGRAASGAGNGGAAASGAGNGGAADGVAVDALRELAEPWAALDPLPPGLLYRFLESAPDESVARAAIEVAARHGHRDLLFDVAADGRRPEGLRRRALESLGELAAREDIGSLVELAACDPLLLAGPLVRCLRGLHRRGHFPAAGHVPAIVALAVADHTVPAAEVATIVFTCRGEALRELTAAAADDPQWPRRLEVLLALAAQGAVDLPVGERVTELLAEAADARPFLAAIRVLRPAGAEEAVIAALPRSPGAALEALEAVGGARAVVVLRAGLGLGDEAGAVVSHLGAVRRRALEVLWHLTEDPDERRSILVRLDPREVPARIAADLGGPDERELALLRAGLDPCEPVAALCTLARHGSSAMVPVIADLLVRIVSELAASWRPDQSGGAEPVVPAEVVAAIADLGAHLHARGKIRPHCLLDAGNAREAGDALVASIALDLVDRRDLVASEQMILLGLLLRTNHRGIRARVHPLLRHRDRHVRKHVIALLARDAEGEDARALSASLIPLTRASDAQTVRQALVALGHARAGWAAAAIAACLDHPAMNVKKSAAAALVPAGAPVAVPKLLVWLGRHDNPGLRASLVEALRAIVGEAFAATVVAAAERAGDSRTRDGLLSALDSALSGRAVEALAAQGSPAGAALAALVAAGRVALDAGTAARPVRAADAEVGVLVSGGWDAGIARRVARRYDPGPGVVGGEGGGAPVVLRPMLDRWLELAGDGSGDRGRVLRFVLRLCPAPWSADEVRVFARSVRTLVAGLADVGVAHRDGLLALVAEAVGWLSPVEAFGVASRVRALPPQAVGAGRWCCCAGAGRC